MTNHIKNLRVIFYITLLSPLILIGIYSIVLEEGAIMLNDSVDSVFKYLIPVFGIIFISIGFLFFRARLKVINKEVDVNIRMQLYKGIIIIRFAFIEGVAVFSSVAYMITLNNLYIVYMLLALAIFFPIYPTQTKIYRDLGFDTDTSTINLINDVRQKKGMNKKSWLILPLIILMFVLNFKSFKDFFSNRIVLPDNEFVSGTIADSIYHNDYLNWTMIIPSGYETIPFSEIKENERKGRELLNSKSKKRNKDVRLLDITNGSVYFNSLLEPRALFPNLTDEAKYIELIEKNISGVISDSIVFEKRNQGVFMVDSVEFKYVEYLKSIRDVSIGILFITKFNEEFILDISISYSNSDDAIKLLTNFVNSDFDWK